MSRRELTYWLESSKPSGARSKSKRKPILGFGINDAEYCTNQIIDGVKVMCPAYLCWKHMLHRCYSKKFLDKNNTYHGVSVCREWLVFSSFRDWWLTNSVDGWHLDKDILGTGKIYSPDSCIFVPAWVNCITLDRKKMRGKFAIGASFKVTHGSFEAYCRNPIEDKKEFLGYFESDTEAHKAWLNRKIEIVTSLKKELDLIDCRLFDRIVDIVMSAK